MPVRILDKMVALETSGPTLNAKQESNFLSLSYMQSRPIWSEHFLLCALHTQGSNLTCIKYILTLLQCITLEVMH